MTVLAPRQARSEATQRRILAACEQLLAQRPFEQISMQDIANEAGVSVGNLYNRFSDKEGLVDCVLGACQERFEEGVKALFDESGAGMDISDRLTAFVDHFKKGITALRPLFVTMATRLAQGDSIGPPVAARSASLVDTCASWLVQGDPTLDVERCRFAIASITSSLQFDLLFQTQSRLFGENYEQYLVEQAHAYLVQSN